MLITGAKGVLGSHLTEKLIELGHDCFPIDREYDITLKSSFNRITFEPDVVFHLAAISRVAVAEADPIKCLEVNVIGLMNLILWSLKQPKQPYIIFTSSHEAQKPICVYGLSKATTEHLLMHYSKNYSIVRLSNVYGSKRDIPERVIPTFVRNALKNESLIVNGENKELDFLYIDDAIQGLVKLISKTGSNETFDMCSGQRTRILDLALEIIQLTKSQSSARIVQSKSYETNKFVGDYSRAKELLGYSPEFKLEAGLRKYISELI